MFTELKQKVTQPFVLQTELALSPKYHL